MLRSAPLLLALATAATATINLHNPRGSNNRLSDDNEAIPTNTQRRLFNSQNRNQGGYNAPAREYAMKYFVGSVMPIEWTINQGCGSNTEGGGEGPAHCDIVLQYMCADTVRDGAMATPIQDNMESEWEKTEDGLTYKYGMHENYMYYMSCKQRQRNRGLFTADREISGNSARYTRQNRGGQMYGYECPEERDYYPYWQPTPWKDIAIITDRTERCDYYKQESQNVKSKGFCEADLTKIKEDDCPTWKNVAPWQDSRVFIQEPECLEAPWVKDGQLSNTIEGYPMMYNWTIPDEGRASCVLRVRYNVSMGDWETWNYGEKEGLDYKSNGENSPIGLRPQKLLKHENGSVVLDGNGVPVVDVDTRGPMIQDCCSSVGGGLCECGLYVHPQYAPFHTFQDRSHRFLISPRPEQVNNLIHNLNVRGKRGNIVQTYPAVEHDFVPNVLDCKEGEWMHIQWTGSDNNRDNVAGEGTDGTDRSMIVQIKTQKHNYPIDFESQNLFDDQQAIRLAYNDLAGYDKNFCKSIKDLLAIDNENDREEDEKNCAKLNAAKAYYDGGLQPCPAAGTYYYMSARENNFSNRGQKGVIRSVPCTDGNANCSNVDEVALGTTAVGPTGSSATTVSVSVVSVMAALAALLH